MADQKAMKKRLKALMTRPENQMCSDCPERQPRWASLIVPPPGAPPGSLPIGAFCCLECSGSHRRLGVHISFVRSVNLDSWKEKEVQAMENGGNAKVNAIFEARLGQSGVQKPSNHADGPTRERFIRDKYERRKFYDPQAFSSADAIAPPEQHDDIVLPALAQPGPPSDAARQRLEQRKARSLKPSSSFGSDDGRADPSRRRNKPSSRKNSGRNMGDGKSRTKVVKAPASAPPPSLDLLDLTADPAPAVAPNQAQSFGESNQDMLDFLSASAAPEQASRRQSDLTQAPVNSKSASADIMSLYAQSTPQQQNFGVMTSTGNPNTNNTATVNNMMQNLNMGGGAGMSPGMSPGMTQQQMLYQQQMAMMNQPKMAMMTTPQGRMTGTMSGGMQPQGNNMMMMQQGNNLMMMQQNNNNVTMMMQQQQPSNGGGFVGAPMGSGPSMSVIQQQQSNGTSAAIQEMPPEKEDPFAQFGKNVFRP